MKRFAKIACLVLVLGCLIPSAPVAQEDNVTLSLDQCLRTALENNLDLVSARKDPLIAEQRIGESDAAFDGVIGVDGNFNQVTADQRITGTLTDPDPINNPPLTFSDTGTFDQDRLRGNLTWSQLLGYGATYDITVSSENTDEFSRSIQSVTNELEERLIDDLNDNVTLSYSMPLLRGLGREATQVDVLLARSGLDISNEDFRLSAIQTMKSTEDAYWDLVAARAAHEVAKESLKLAQDLYEQNKKKVEVGSLAPIDVTQAEAGVASREEDVIVAEATVRNAEDNLRRFMAIPPDDPSWSAVLEPTDQPSFREEEVDVDAAIQTALDRRPEIINSRRSLRDSELSERVARNGARHSLTFDASITPFEQERDTLVDIQNTLDDYPTSDTGLVSDGHNWSVGLTYGYTIGNKRAKANYAIARINREKGELGVRIVEQDIRVDVRAAARAVTSGAKRVAAARANTVLQRKNVEAEQKKYENGMSTSFEVLRIQNDLSDAQFAEIQAMLDYTKALADLERAKGTLLEARGLALGS
ncbi:MAG: TolC family protein [Acidobacteria bacterium]|nr:TolC family protein [Acidobacteriota bacterium]NIM64314.1 TolC family protein [Acidobacteriota bacterium]NIQ84957.1 TolC family protein [Acidobacteriota bacterium]NIT10771.1 TolC family protein [Acidobacteriota bacterium]